MPEYFSDIVNIIKYVLQDYEMLEAYTSISSNFLMGVLGILGLSFIKPLKDKTFSATFTFWSQLRVRLKNISDWLEQDKDLLNNMYNSNIRKTWSTLTPEIDRIESFKEIVEETLQYIQQAADQMPAFVGWSKEYNETIKNLQEFILFDICEPNKYFKYNKPETIEQRNQYISSICSSIDLLCNEIEEKQNKLEKKILKHF